MTDNVNDIATAYYWSISRMAQVFGLDRRTVARRLEDARVPSAGMSRGHPTYELRYAGPALFGQVIVSAQDPDDMTATDHRAWYQSENERLKFERDCREMSLMAKCMVNTLDSLPDILERDCGLTAEAIEHVSKTIDAQREQLYLRITTESEEEAADEEL